MGQTRALLYLATLSSSLAEALVTAEEAASSLAATIHPSIISATSPSPPPPAPGAASGKLGKSRLEAMGSGGTAGGTSPAAAVHPAVSGGEKGSLPSSGGEANDEGRTDKPPVTAATATAAIDQEATCGQDVRQRRQQVSPQQAAQQEQEPLIAQGGGTLQVGPLPHCHCHLSLEPLHFGSMTVVTL